MRFLTRAERQSKRRVDRWLVLLARISALLLPLAALCAATPWAESIWQRVAPGAPDVVTSAPRTHRVIIVDSSLSMGVRQGERTGFDAALALAGRAVTESRPGDGFTVIASGVGARPIVPGPALDPDAVLAEIARIKPTDGAGDLPGALSLAADALARSPRNFPRRQVVIVTDLQRSAWGGLLAKPDGTLPELWSRLTTRAEVVVVDATQAEVDNVGITGLTLTDPLALAGMPTGVVATVENFGRGDLRAVGVELLLARPGQPGVEPALVPVEQRVVDLVPAGERVTVAFALNGPARFRSAGTHLLQVRLLPGDNLPADDRRTLSVDVRESLTAVVVNGKPSADPVARAGEYARRALSPGRTPGGPVRAKLLSLAEFADPTLGDLSAVDCVVLADVPTLADSQVTRLEAHLKRGGGLVIGLGPNAAANVAIYNRVLYANGEGILPGPLGEVRSAPGGYRLFGDETAFRSPPLVAFRDDNARAGLSLVPITKYLALDAPAGGRARRLLSMVPVSPTPVADTPAGSPAAAPADPAVTESPRGRGKVFVVTTSLNADWTDWPVLPTYLPFIQELARASAPAADRRTLNVGEAIEEFVPVTRVGLRATLTPPGGVVESADVVAGDQVGIARFDDTPLAGIYRVSAGVDQLFAVNPAESGPGGGAESDPQRLSAADFRALGGAVRLATDPADSAGGSTDEGVVLGPRPRGPTLARWALAVTLTLLAAELILAWRAGPARSRVTPSPTRGRFRKLTLALGMIPLTIALIALAVRAHEQFTGELLSFAPTSVRDSVERWLGAPPSAPGEGAHLRLESSPAFLRTAVADARLSWGLFALGALLTLALYRLERRAAGGMGRVVLPACLRLAAWGIAAFVLLPQLKLSFEREGFPDVAILLDTSASMDAIDEPRDPATRAKMDELKRYGNLEPADRLALAKQLVAGRSPDLLERLLAERQVKLHIYRVADQAQLVTEVAATTDLPAAREAVERLKPNGQSSRLGDAVESIIKSFRGGSLTAVIAYTDGVVTAGEDWTHAGREAARAGVPLYLVGVGDGREPFDVALAEVRADDTVLKGDTLVIEARVSARGGQPGKSVPVILFERKGDTKIERGRETVRLDATGKPVPVRLAVTPTEAGEITYSLEIPPQPGEAEAGNNHAERVVLVSESRKLRVLYLDGYPRYEFRFLKSLLEREAPQAGRKSIELSTILADASPGYAEQDKSALRGLPTKAELFDYDVVILGDVDPAKLPQAGPLFGDLAEFVTEKGGGLLIIAGTQSSPASYFATPLAGVLPVASSDTTPTAIEAPITEGYRPTLTPYGRTHPLFRFGASEAESAKVWAELKPLYWSASGYKRKLTAEVLATHPERPGEGAGGELHPLVLQQFAGSGRVLFFGFDETWRWRFRADEERYNQFWTQAIRALAKDRVSRAELRPDRQTAYRRGEPIRLTARFPDDAPAPAGNSVRVRVDRRAAPNAPFESEMVQLAKIDGSRATYQTLLTRTPEGEYRFELTDPPPTPLPDTPPGSFHPQQRVAQHEVRRRAGGDPHGGIEHDAAAEQARHDDADASNGLLAGQVAQQRDAQLQSVPPQATGGRAQGERQANAGGDGDEQKEPPPPQQSVAKGLDDPRGERQRPPGFEQAGEQLRHDERHQEDRHRHRHAQDDGRVDQGRRDAVAKGGGALLEVGELFEDQFERAGRLADADHARGEFVEQLRLLSHRVGEARAAGHPVAEAQQRVGEAAFVLADQRVQRLQQRDADGQ